MCGLMRFSLSTTTHKKAIPIFASELKVTPAVSVIPQFSFLLTWRNKKGGDNEIALTAVNRQGWIFFSFLVPRKDLDKFSFHLLCPFLFFNMWENRPMSKMFTKLSGNKRTEVTFCDRRFNFEKGIWTNILVRTVMILDFRTELYQTTGICINGIADRELRLWLCVIAGMLRERR